MGTAIRNTQAAGGNNLFSSGKVKGKHFLFWLTGVVCSVWLHTTPLQSQYAMGVTGGLNIPTADMQADGTFMMGANYLPKQLMPDRWGYNTGNYFVNLTFLPFMELAYRCTLLRVRRNGEENLEQDRSVSIRLRPLKEGRYRPSLVVGSNDVLTTRGLNVFKEYEGRNRHFSSVYAVMTKHIWVDRHDLGFTLGVNMLGRQDAQRNGVFAGLSYTPAFLDRVSLMAEYDTKAFNMGVSARLWNHFSLHAFCYDLKVVSGGIRYEFILFTQ